MRRLRKFYNLTSRDRHLLIRAALLIGMIRLALWLLPFQAWWRLLARNTLSPKKLQKTQISLGKIVWAVAIASRYMPGEVKCLARSVAAQILLAQQGYQAQLRIGVAKGKAGLEAHAWVESQGTIVIGRLKDLQRYTPLPSLGARLL